MEGHLSSVNMTVSKYSIYNVVVNFLSFYFSIVFGYGNVC